MADGRHIEDRLLAVFHRPIFRLTQSLVQRSRKRQLLVFVFEPRCPAHIALHTVLFVLVILSKLMNKWMNEHQTVRMMLNSSVSLSFALNSVYSIQHQSKTRHNARTIRKIKSVFFYLIVYHIW